MKAFLLRPIEEVERRKAANSQFELMNVLGQQSFMSGDKEQL